MFISVKVYHKEDINSIKKIIPGTEYRRQEFSHQSINQMLAIK